MLDSVFISLYVVLTDQILLHLPPPTSSITISLSHTMIMAKTLFHDPFRIFHFETQESIREIGKNGTITLNSLLHSSFNNDGSSQGYVSSPTFQDGRKRKGEKNQIGKNKEFRILCSYQDWKFYGFLTQTRFAISLKRQNIYKEPTAQGTANMKCQTNDLNKNSREARRQERPK